MPSAVCMHGQDCEERELAVDDDREVTSSRLRASANDPGTSLSGVRSGAVLCRRLA